MRNKRFWLVLAILLIGLAILGNARKNREHAANPAPAGEPASVQEVSAEVPARFRAIYSELDERLNAFDSYLDGQPDRGGEPVFAAELLAANGNRGEALLGPQGFRGAVVYLDSLQKIGVEGVTVQMPYPLMDASFPRSEEYWDFYKRLAAEVKRRGLKLLVKNGPVFTESEISPVKPDYSGITWDEYFEARKAIALRVVREMAPDYLSIGNEPSTEMMVLGKTGLTEDRFVRFAKETLSEIDRSRTLIGAGAGNWDRLSFVEKLAAETDLDYIDLHIYPLASSRDDYLRRAPEMAAIAREHGKRLIIGEFWFYKAGARELTATPTHVEMFGRDTFGFWAPLDQKMIRVMMEFARKADIEYVSGFWSKYYFAYLDHAEHGRKSAGQLLRLADEEAVKNILANKLSPTGAMLRELLN